jgi:hypothetical protein
MSSTIDLEVTRVTKDTGATEKPGPMVVAEAAQTTTEADLSNVAAGSGLNGPFLTDLVASFGAHENMGVSLYRVLAGLTANPMLQSHFRQFEADSLQAARVHQQLLVRLGAPAQFIGPSVRMTEGLDSKMIESFLAAGSADQLTLDLKAVDTAFLASTLCVANTNTLAAIAASAKGETQQALKDAITQLDGPQREHLDWARMTRERMALTMVKHPVAQKLTQFAEDVIGKVKNAIS